MVTWKVNRAAPSSWRIARRPRVEPSDDTSKVVQTGSLAHHQSCSGMLRWFLATYVQDASKLWRSMLSLAISNASRSWSLAGPVCETEESAPMNTSRMPLGGGR